MTDTTKKVQQLDIKNIKHISCKSLRVGFEVLPTYISLTCTFSKTSKTTRNDEARIFQEVIS